VKTSRVSTRHNSANSSAQPSGADTELAFIEVATRLFAQKGFKGTSISDLCRELNLTTASLYYYVDSKQDLLARVLETGMVDFLTRLEAIESSSDAPAARLEQAVENHIDFVIDRRDVVRVFLRYRSMLHDAPREHYQQMLDQYQTLFTRIISDAQTSRSDDTDVFLLRQMVLGMINSTVEWYEPYGRLKKDELKAEMTRLIVDRLLLQS